MRKWIYGLAGGSQYWYLKVCEEPGKLEAKSSKLDQGVFIF